jgi:hypothetical protein
MLPPGLRSALQRARGEGATYVESGGGQRLVFRPAGDKWQAAMIKHTNDGMWYATPWQVAPFGGWLPDSAQTIDDAIRRSN